MLKKLYAKLKEAKTNRNILKDEAKFLKDSDRYDFFGYFMDEERELPVFITEGEVKDNCRMGEFVYVYTPKMLEHCVKYLTEEAKLNEIQDIESFKKKCNKLAAKSIYQKESWESKISDLIKYLQNFKKAKEYEEKVLLSNEQFEKFDVLYDGFIPSFYTYKIINGMLDLQCCENLIATPSILNHCVKHLTDKAKQNEAKNIQDFIEKCAFIIYLDDEQLFLEKDWNDVLDNLIKYIQSYNKTNENNV